MVRAAWGISGDVAGRISTWLEEAYPGTVAIWSSGAAGDVDPVLFNAVLYPDHRDGSYVKEDFESWKTTQKLLNMIASCTTKTYGKHWRKSRVTDRKCRFMAQWNGRKRHRWRRPPIVFVCRRCN